MTRELHRSGYTLLLKEMQEWTKAAGLKLEETEDLFCELGVEDRTGVLVYAVKIGRCLTGKGVRPNFAVENFRVPWIYILYERVPDDSRLTRVLKICSDLGMGMPCKARFPTAKKIWESGIQQLTNKNLSGSQARYLRHAARTILFDNLLDVRTWGRDSTECARSFLKNIGCDELPSKW